MLTSPGPLPSAALAQAASVEQGCQQWVQAMPTGEQVGSAAWCGEMTHWMRQRIGDTGTAATMMWGDPDHMASACEQWMTAEPPTPGGGSNSWCSSMVGWMRANLSAWSGRGTWSDWMTHRSMMGP